MIKITDQKFTCIKVEISPINNYKTIVNILFERNGKFYLLVNTNLWENDMIKKQFSQKELDKFHSSYVDGRIRYCTRESGLCEVELIITHDEYENELPYHTSKNVIAARVNRIFLNDYFDKIYFKFLATEIKNKGIGKKIEMKMENLNMRYLGNNQLF